MSKKNSLVIVAIFLGMIAFSIKFFWREAKDEKDLEDRLEKNMVGNIPQAAPQTAASQVQGNSAQTAAQNSQIQGSPQSVPPDVSQDQSETPEKLPEDNASDEKKDWKTYADSKDKFEFKYPPDGSAVSSGSWILVSDQGKNWKIKVYENKKKDEIETWYNGYFSEKERANCVFSSSTLKIGSYDTKYVNPNSGETECSQDGHFSQNSEKTKVVRVKPEKASEEDMKKILETFKFN